STIGGYTGGNKIWETSSDEWDKMLSKNLKANFLICKFFALAVQKAAGGSICLTSAYTGVSPEIGKAAYGTSKSALNYLVKTLALEGTEIGLSANAIAPLIIDTPSNREWGNEDDFTKWQKPEEIGEIVLDLFANYKSVTGNIIELKERLNI
ncbi:MAG: SDR family NAD(P)-dependent oxidoreductase, partial [Bacteroidota bacterium]|nr:SDR family NAD(P)-dependent oxidoreductase [Bacteroidota bacterium]